MNEARMSAFRAGHMSLVIVLIIPVIVPIIPAIMLIIPVIARDAWPLPMIAPEMTEALSVPQVPTHQPDNGFPILLQLGVADSTEIIIHPDLLN